MPCDSHSISEHFLPIIQIFGTLISFSLSPFAGSRFSRDFATRPQSSVHVRSVSAPRPSCLFVRFRPHVFRRSRPIRFFFFFKSLSLSVTRLCARWTTPTLRKRWVTNRRNTVVTNSACYRENDRSLIVIIDDYCCCYYYCDILVVGNSLFDSFSVSADRDFRSWNASRARPFFLLLWKKKKKKKWLLDTHFPLSDSEFVRTSVVYSSRRWIPHFQLP